MNVWAYCAHDWRKATRQAGGVIPITSPPAEAGAQNLTKAATADIVYLNLHGFAGQPYLYGQQAGAIGPTALTPEDVAAHKWHGVVFAEVCYSAADGGGPIAQAFLESGARAFIGSTTEAYGRVRMTWWDGEADRLMWLFRHAYTEERTPQQALSLAKRALRIMSWPLDEDDKQTLRSFVCLERKS